MLRINQKTISTYVDFVRTVKSLIELDWGKENITFISAYPNISEVNNISAPIITYKLNLKEPALYGKTTREIKPRIRETLRITDEVVEIDSSLIPLKGGVVEVWGQAFEYNINFQIWADNGEQADELAERFQQFMFKYIGYLKSRGVQEMIFLKQYCESQGNLWRTDLQERSVQYYVKIDAAVGAKVPAIEKILVSSVIDELDYEMNIEIGKPVLEKLLEQLKEDQGS